jgi:hypothetical protein
VIGRGGEWEMGRWGDTLWNFRVTPWLKDLIMKLMIMRKINYLIN